MGSSAWLFRRRRPSPCHLSSREGASDAMDRLRFLEDLSGARRLRLRSRPFKAWCVIHKHRMVRSGKTRIHSFRAILTVLVDSLVDSRVSRTIYNSVSRPSHCAVHPPPESIPQLLAPNSCRQFKMRSSPVRLLDLVRTYWRASYNCRRLLVGRPVVRDVVPTTVMNRASLSATSAFATLSNRCVIPLNCHSRYANAHLASYPDCTLGRPLRRRGQPWPANPYPCRGGLRPSVLRCPEYGRLRPGRMLEWQADVYFRELLSRHGLLSPERI